MVRFSCFNAHIHGSKSKKQAQPTFETMVKILQTGSRNETSINSMDSACLSPPCPPPPVHVNVHNNFSDKMEQIPVMCPVSNSEDMNDTSLIKSDACVSPTRQSRLLRRSLSLGCNLQDEDGRVFDDNINYDDDERLDHDGGYSWNGSQDRDDAEFSGPADLKSLGTTTAHHDPLFMPSDSPVIGDPQCEANICLNDHETPMSAESVCEADDSGNSHTPRTPPMIAKCCSMPNFYFMPLDSGGYSPKKLTVPRSKSSEDLSVIGNRRKKVSAHDAGDRGRKEDDMLQTCGGVNAVPGGYDSYDYANKDWIIPAVDEIQVAQNFQGESSSHQWDQLPSKDFKIKRIKDWMADLQHCSPGVEMDEISDDLHHEKKRGPNLPEGALDALRLETKKNPGTEAAKKYISSLNPAATTAQLANHGLVVIPFFSAFVSLKVLNLSGNSIVRITSGALPRGLHMLNLAKNKISTIEGLRDLTRLRILDLSYNKITRIGHGLASCSSLKELYLAGNKFSEVEGLHRLLKLTVLDLRFNKVSTTKCLGQLAANYKSLQAISLEGNPAQKNVGDEQLKKYLLGLLPSLAYYNRQAVKSSILKDSSDKAVRLGMGAHQFDRGHKSTRRGSHGVFAPKHSSSGVLIQKGQAVDSHQSPNRSKSSRRGHPPHPGGAKASHNQHDICCELSGLRPDLAIRKSRSMGTLAVL